MEKRLVIGGLLILVIFISGCSETLSGQYFMSLKQKDPNPPDGITGVCTDKGVLPYPWECERAFWAIPENRELCNGDEPVWVSCKAVTSTEGVPFPCLSTSGYHCTCRWWC